MSATPETGLVVVLDRIEPGVVPEYCCHGRAPCVRCREWCWLGHSTHDVVFTGQALPICRQCAAVVIPPGDRPVDRIRDHRRADGPHE